MILLLHCFYCVCSVYSAPAVILSRFVLSAGRKNAVIRFPKSISTMTKNAEVHGELLGGCCVLFVAELCKWASWQAKSKLLAVAVNGRCPKPDITAAHMASLRYPLYAIQEAARPAAEVQVALLLSTAPPLSFTSAFSLILAPVRINHRIRSTARKARFYWMSENLTDRHRHC